MTRALTEQLAGQAVNLCLKRGADRADALVTLSKETTAEAFDHTLKVRGGAATTQMNLRAFRGPNAAVISANGLLEAMLPEVIERAMDLMNASSPDKHFGPADEAELQSPGPLPDLKIYDPALASITPDLVAGLAQQSQVAMANRDSRAAHLTTTLVEVRSDSLSLCISGGFLRTYDSTTVTSTVKAVTEGDRAKIGTASVSSRSLAALDLGKAVSQTAFDLLRALDVRRPPSGRFPVVFSPEATRGLLTILIVMTSGSLARFSEKLFLSKLGDAISSPALTIVDDPLTPAGIGSVPFDHEGVRPRRKLIIEEGRLNEYFLNSYYGRALNRSSTGSAWSNHDVRNDVRPSNACIVPGEATTQSIIADIIQGLYVTKLTSREISLTQEDFIESAEGVWIENGRLSYSVPSVAISHPFADFWKSIAAVGDDVCSFGPLSCPSLMVRSMNITPSGPYRGEAAGKDRLGGSAFMDCQFRHRTKI